MSQDETIRVQINEAWGLLRQGNARDAISTLEDLLRTSPDNTDAIYGLGLAYAHADNKAKAIEMFQRNLDVIQTNLEKVRAEHGVEEGEVILHDHRDDRYVVLKRMTEQRLDELSTATV